MEEDLASLKIELRSLVVSSPTPVTTSILIKDYRNLIGRELPIIKFGYRNVITFIQEKCSDSFVLEGNPRNPVLTPIVPDTLKHIDRMISNQNIPTKDINKGRRRSIYLNGPTGCPMPRNTNRNKTQPLNTSSKTRVFEEMKLRMRTLIAENPDGIWCVDLMTMYKQRFNKDLSYLSVGCSSVIELVRRMKDIFHIERPSCTGDWLLYDATRPLPTPRLRLPGITDIIETVRWPDEDALPGVPYEPGVFPEDSMQLGEIIPVLSLAEVIKVGDVLDTEVTEAYSPSHFWLLKFGEDQDNNLEKLTHSMNIYYKGEGADRCISLGAVQEGYFVSACYRSEWYRAAIVKILDSENVKIRYIDYGNIEKVHSRTLKPLLKIYAQLPAQAIRARLAGVKPPSQIPIWPNCSCSAFLSVTINTALTAEVVSVDTTENILEVYLFDTHPEQVSINVELIKSKYAVNHFSSYLHATDSHLYPKFEVLEKALSFSYQELEEMRALGLRPEYMDDYKKHIEPPFLTTASQTSPQDKCVTFSPQFPDSLSDKNDIETIEISYIDIMVFLKLASSDAKIACEFIKKKFELALLTSSVS